MGEVLFTNVRILDGSGDAPATGEVLVQGNRIRRVSRGGYGGMAGGARSGGVGGSGGQTVIDGAGATLMPGLCDAHAHFSWNDQDSLEAIQRMPPEEHTLFSAGVAKTYLDMGFTSAVGAAAAKPRLDVVIRNAINAGTIPGPRYLANGQEIATLGGLGDTSPPHIDIPELSFGVVVSGAEEMRAVVRRFIKYGVDLLKLNLSGEEIAGVGAEETPMTDEEAAVAVSEARRRGKRVCAHARSAESVKMCVRHGIEIVYHASFADEEALDMLEAQKDRFFVAPGLAWLVMTSSHAEKWGIDPNGPLALMYKRELEAAVETMRKMHRRGIRVLPGGDYGFAWTPHGTNAKDLEYFVEMIGMSPMEAIVSATRYGGQIMGKPDELGQVREGFLADLILVDGDPLSNIRILQDRKRILAVMKDGSFHRAPEVSSQSRQIRWAS
ncbi:Imidazolonepropionase [Tistlia consotensis]|uniref:Imidazolonepropionase n=1 Tax=Tistlia consotensis USBA 355 TaxID=560819 RepID=A0A1Y6CB41_9PROT|nr:amidohydrolase family protein [Tistlia consotensis]SMF55055.1 Imidazolonepropionase [Tistlia consotensis USBA 355]SNR87574.1 Imidazolonepropionase [Tistlia consotensis]